MRNRIRTFGVLLLMLPLFVQAQDEYLRMVPNFLRSQIYYETITVPAASGQTALVVSFRIPNDRLVFLQNTEQTNPNEAFVARAEFTIEVLKGGDVLAREVWRDENHYAARYEDTINRDHDVEGQVAFFLEPGTYAYRIGFKDLNGTLDEARSPVRRVEVVDYSALQLGRPIMLDHVEPAAHIIHLVNLSGDAPYARSSQAAVPFSLPTGIGLDDVTLTYNIRDVDPEEQRRKLEERREQIRKQQRKETEEAEVMEDLQFDGDALLRNATVPAEQIAPITAFATEHFQPGQVVIPHTERATNQYMAYFDLGTERLSNGNFVLELTLEAGGTTVDQSVTFATHWRNIPLSLNSLDVAIENLKFIEHEDNVKAMKEGTFREKRTRFEAYWEERDPTPNTQFNELMTEYYSRIDFASWAYRNAGSGVPDGLRTDRAKIYIVNGPPERTARSLPTNGGVRETWYYPNGRLYTFEATSSLAPYRLVRSGQ